MDELFLHYVWQYQKFEKKQLKTTDGQTLAIYKVGFKNLDSGPDFKNARVRINDLEWSGNVEIHIKSSDWDVHKHGNDAAYDSVILHVVWRDDRPISRKDGTRIPTLELGAITDKDFLNEYRKLVSNPDVIPCASHISQISNITFQATIDKLAVERLQFKSSFFRELLRNQHDDWEEASYQFLARSFGIKINQDSFMRLAQLVPLKIVRKHADHPGQVQALFYGVAGFLDDIDGQYGMELKNEWVFLKHKYQLNEMHRTHWKFSKLRPPSFPTIRIAQLVKLIIAYDSIYSMLVNLNDHQILSDAMRLSKDDYWYDHYDFNKPLKSGINNAGKAFLQGIMVNAIAPLLSSIALEHDSDKFKEQALSILEGLPKEQNKITRLFQELGVNNESAMDSQALIQLHNEYCVKKRCLACNIGVNILKK
ncbi:MAG: DUF2851 family protein [Cyclobacteriaceae bacterium]